MQKPSKLILGSAAALLILTGGGSAGAQTLWKYTDQNGKVTYSDKAPKNGEKAEPVNADTKANVLDAPRLPAPKAGATGKNNPNAKSLAEEREKKREALRDALADAQTALADAKKALEDGRDPLPEERQIVVGRNKEGAPTGINSTTRKPEYFTRIGKLEEAVKNAEAKLEVAERNYRRDAPN